MTNLLQASNSFRRFAAVLIAWSALTTFAVAQSAIFVPPPRTVADITAILDQQKPDADRVGRARAAADAEPPHDVDARALVDFYYRRGDARSEIGRLSEAIADLNKGIALSHDHNIDVTPLRMQVGFLYSWSGDNKSALQSFLTVARENEKPETEGRLFPCYRWIAQVYINLGDLAQAEVYVRKVEALFERYRTSTKDHKYRDHYFTQVELGRGRLFEARGQFREAEEAYRSGYDSEQNLLRSLAGQSLPTLRTNIDTLSDNLTASGGRVKARQGRFAEGEADTRRALLSRLGLVGKYNLTTARTIPYLSTILIEEGRYSEAEKLTRTTIEIYLALGASKDSLAYAFNLSELGTILGLEGRWSDAAKVYGELDGVIVGWEPARRADLLLTPARVYSLYKTGSLQLGIAEAAAMVARLKARVGEEHFDYAVARGILAIGLSQAGRHTEAIREFRTAIPILTTTSGESSDDEESSTAAAREQYTRTIVESYIAVLGRSARIASGDEAAVETFGLADAIRGQSVQKALTASSARAVAGDPALAELVRLEQDLQKQVGAQLGLLNNILALSPTERDDRAVPELRHEIERLRAEHEKARQRIAKQFPVYADLVRPKLSTVDGIRRVLKDDEAFLSIYLGQDTSFIWAVPKTGPVAFAVIPASAAEIKTKITKLREALEPNANTIDEIPPFDLALAHELYQSLLQPVEAGWKPAKSLIVATNGALGLLPLGLLPVAAAEIKANAEPPFADYRRVPWLARTHAVTLVPSAAALLTLRHLPAGSDKRERMIGFGDPYFNAEQVTEAELHQAPIQLAAATTMRGLPLKRRAAPQTDGVDRVELSSLPRLPDTADELKSVALALQSDPSKVLHLGRNANEKTVKDADLSRYKIVVFATHGLVPGELNGLHQPALALSAPEVAGVPGDGLLTMDEILGLKLDADWVVLSACNTGAGAGAGAEAASGLGRAFFYAGTRAILVTNWSVHSQSARELVTDLFRRQAADPTISRGEALRQAMMGLLDSQDFTDENSKVLFTYAHPLFWAPYTIIGDGG